jgi:nitroreductase
VDIESTDQLLTTTRSVRKRLDFTRPVEPELIERCLELAMQAPSGSDRQMWHFVVVTDPQLRLRIAELYRRSFEQYAGPVRGPHGGSYAPTTPLAESAVYLAEHFHEAPAHVLFCYEGRVEQSGVMAQAGVYGSILPAAWSFMLALRARGLGTAWTTLHLRYEQEAAALLGLPDTLTQAVLFPVAYTTGGDFRPARRRPLGEVLHWNGWRRPRE